MKINIKKTIIASVMALAGILAVDFGIAYANSCHTIKGYEQANLISHHPHLIYKR